MTQVRYPTAPKGTAYARVFASLAKAGSTYAGSTPKGGLFTCPVHDDTNASLEVDEGSKGVPLLSCPPCEARLGDHEAFIEELGLAGVRLGGSRLNGTPVDWGDVAAVRPGGGGGSHGVKRGRLLDTHNLAVVYTYRFADGTENFRVKRYEPKPGVEAKKVFLPSHLVLGEGWVKGLDGVERTPFWLDHFAKWEGRAIYLVEGEKAAAALHALKRPATTFHGGAKKEPEEGWVTRYGFDRFKEVRLWPDADAAGLAWMRRREAELREAGVKVTWWAVPGTLADSGADAADGVEGARRLKPAEVKALSADLGRSEALEGAGKPLIPAKGWEPADEPAAGQDEPYSVSVLQEPYEFTDEVLNRHFRWGGEGGVLTLRFRNDDRTFWLWSEKKARYEHLSEDEVLALVKARLRGATEVYMLADGPEERRVKITEKVGAEVKAHLKSLTLTSEHGAGALLPSVGGVPFRNGWLDVRTGELLPIGPERDVRWNVQADYEPDSTCVEWMRFLRTLGWGKDSEEYRLLRQWMGYLLSGRKDLDRALLLLGPTRSGKGTIIRVCMALLGDGAVGTTLDSLTRNFGLQNFIGKGLATIGDARFGRSDKALNGILLSLTSNDPLPVDVKYGKPLSINLPVRLMIATNETPNFIEASDALAQRFEALVFDRSFVENPDLGLFNRLSRELPGIARWALGGLRDLEEQGRFSPTQKGKDLQKRMIQESAFVRLFVEECCELGAEFRVANDSLYAEYSVWAEQNRMPVYNSVKFARELHDAFPGSVATVSFRKNGKVVRGQSGVKLR